MAAKGRSQNASAIESLLVREFHRFDFFQAVRVLEGLHPYAVPLGEGSHPEREAVRFSARVGLEFPASGIHGVEAGRTSGGVILTEGALAQVAESEQLSPLTVQRLKPLVDHRFTGREFRGRLRGLLQGQDGGAYRSILQEARRSEPHRMVVTFLGLAGPFGPLPTPYTEMVLDRLKERDHTLVDFLDIFNHRLLSIYYRVRKFYRVGFSPTRPENEPLSRKLLSLTGATREFTQERLTGHERSMLNYVGLFSRRPRSLEGLRTLLSGLYKMPVEIVPLVGAWGKIEPDEQSRIGLQRGSNHMLGTRPVDSEATRFAVPTAQAVLGRRVWDQQSAFRIVLGPMDSQQLNDLLPTGAGLRGLRDMVRSYVGHEYDIQYEFRLKPDQVRPTRLLNVWNYEFRFTGSQLARVTLAGPPRTWNRRARGRRYMAREKVEALMELREVPFDSESEFREAVEQRIGRVQTARFYNVISQFTAETRITADAYRLTPRVLEKLTAEFGDERLVVQLVHAAGRMPAGGFRSAEELTAHLERTIDPGLLRDVLGRILQAARRIQNRPYYNREEFLDALSFAIGTHQVERLNEDTIRRQTRPGLLGGPRLGWNTFLRSGDHEVGYRLTRTSLRRLRSALPAPEHAVLFESMLNHVYDRVGYLNAIHQMLGHDEWDRHFLHHAETLLRPAARRYSLTPRDLVRIARIAPDHIVKRLGLLVGRTFADRSSFVRAMEARLGVDGASERANRTRIRRMERDSSPGRRKDSRKIRFMRHRDRRRRLDQAELKRLHDRILALAGRTGVFRDAGNYRLEHRDIARLRGRLPAELVDRIVEGRRTLRAEGRGLLYRHFNGAEEYLETLGGEIGSYNVLLYRDELLAEGRRDFHDEARFGFTGRALKQLAGDMPRCDFLRLAERIRRLRYLDYADEDEMLGELGGGAAAALVERHREKIIDRALRETSYPTIRLSQKPNSGAPALTANDRTGLSRPANRANHANDSAATTGMVAT